MCPMIAICLGQQKNPEPSGNITYASNIERDFSEQIVHARHIVVEHKDHYHDGQHDGEDDGREPDNHPIPNESSEADACQVEHAPP